MGYQVDHLGSFDVTPPLSEEVQRWIDGPLHDDPWAAAAERDLDLELTTYCTWWTGGDASTLTWTGAEKSYDGAAWLQWLIDHVLGLGGHAVSGTVHRFAEPEAGFVDASRIGASGTHVTEVYYDTGDELPWRDDGPFLGDAFFHLSEGRDEEAQQTLLRWLAITPLTDHGGVAAFLRDVAPYWPEPDAVRAAVEDARGHSPTGRGRLPWWQRLLGR